MTDFPTIAQITDLAALLAPGLIISSIRVRAITGSIPDFKDRVITYAILSTGYFAAVTPFFHVNFGIHIPSWLWSFLQFFFVPVLLGIGAAYAYQHRVSYWPAPSGWSAG